MIDNEIIKALDCCANCESCDFETTNCPLVEEMECRSLLAQKALDLINHLQAKNEKNENIIRLADKTIETANAEIERLQNILMCFMDALGKVRKVDDIDEISLIPLMSELNKQYRAELKAEAYKEFAEKLKKKCYEDFEETDEMLAPYVTEDNIDNLLKEMKDNNKD